MRLVRLLPERWQKFIHEALKFGIVGGINTVINYAVFNALALTVFVNGQLKASVIATIVATITSYLMNRHWTYRDRPKSALRREYVLFFLFNGAGLLIELGAVAAAKYGLDIHGLLALNVAKTAGVLLATLFRFWSYRTFVFQPVAKTEVEPEAKPASTWHSIPRDEWDTMAEMDPVAELAETVSELEEAESAERADPPPGAPTQGRSKRLSVSPAADLDAELAAELHVSTRRAPRR
ncbi:polysaccharide synthesis protein GtrA [Micromonospora arborensis]|uniref:Polysaccharide synthesis protein GtrA n=1 Tax=Micromonospora arborensis TaxID=2116518 RepID=A0A318NMU9_9ACTN|nr:GtrA family protein [Micromonospora arborensis]PYC70024.1 polysaccharide synthesis protein GtrA [Micromonospora arborensis]